MLQRQYHPDLCLKHQHHHQRLVLSTSSYSLQTSIDSPFPTAPRVPPTVFVKPDAVFPTVWPIPPRIPVPDSCFCCCGCSDIFRWSGDWYVYSLRWVVGGDDWKAGIFLLIALDFSPTLTSAVTQVFILAVYKEYCLSMDLSFINTNSLTHATSSATWPRSKENCGGIWCDVKWLSLLPRFQCWLLNEAWRYPIVQQGSQYE